MYSTVQYIHHIIGYLPTYVLFCTTVYVVQPEGCQGAKKASVSSETADYVYTYLYLGTVSVPAY